MSPSPPALEGSLVLGRYRIAKPLARGGMGMVYLGRVEGAAGFAKPVVIKRILSEAEEATHESAHVSFIREARILSELQHPGIVGVLDFGHERDTYLMVLEYVHGYHSGTGSGSCARYGETTSTRRAWSCTSCSPVRIHSRIGT